MPARQSHRDKRVGFHQVGGASSYVWNRTGSRKPKKAGVSKSEGVVLVLTQNPDAAFDESALQRNKAPHGRIGEAVLPGFDVTRQPVFESRVLATVTMRSYQPKNSSSERPTPIRAGNSNK